MTSLLPSSVTITKDEIRDRAHGRLVTVPRKRPWIHKLWREGPRDQPNLWSKEEEHGRDAHATLENTSLARVEIPPLVLIRTVADRQLVVAASDDARALGIRPGMTLTEARALCPRVTHADHDPAADARGLEALARWMHRFTPVVALPESDPKSEISNLKSQISDHHLFLDLTGCARVFNGLSNIVQMIDDALDRMNLSFNLALAPTPGAAWGLASYGSSEIPNLKSEISDLLDSLSSLPPAALRIDPDTAHALHHLGIDTIAQLLALPRASLPARFGAQLLIRLDQALGRAEEILLPLPHHIPIESSIEFDGAVESLEVLHIALRQLLREIVPELLRRGCGARKIRAVFRRFYAPPIEKTVQLARPSRSVMNLFELLRCALEHVDMDAGFTGITIHVPVFERLTEQQIALLAQEECDAQAELDHLVDRLVARLGDQALRQPKLLESYIPERRFTWHGFSTRDSSPVHSKKTRVENPCHEEVRRPLELLAEPVEVQVMVSPSHDRDGRPILFRNGRDVHELRHAVGPERISGEWWRNHHKTRDYFDVENTAGKRFWLFRVNENRKWFLHGIFM